MMRTIRTRLSLFAATVVLVATTAALVAARPAHALSPPPPEAMEACAAKYAALPYDDCWFGIMQAKPSYKGWTYLNPGCAADNGLLCDYGILGAHSQAGWRWTGTRWVAATLQSGWVYVYPYSAPWRWAWTSRTGWVAVKGGTFEVRGV